MKRFLFLLLLSSGVVRGQYVTPVPTGPESTFTKTLKTKTNVVEWQRALLEDKTIPFGITIEAEDAGTNYLSDAYVDGSFSIGKGEIDLRSFPGIVEGGSVDCYAGLTNAFNYCTNNGLTLVPRGTYLLSKTVTLPHGLRMKGMPMDLTYRGNSRGVHGAVFLFTTNITAFQTPRLTAPTDTSAYWARDIHISNIYIKGPQSQGSANSSSVGIDFSHAFFNILENVHVEGFGTGILFRNGSDNYLINGWVQNNYTGIKLEREVGSYDAILTCLNPVNINNVVPWVLSNPRSFFVYGGVTINNLTNDVPKVSIENVRDDSQIVFDAHVMENQSPYAPRFKTDSYGAGNVTIQNCNLAIDQNTPIIEASGFVDNIRLLNNQYQRAIRTNQAPLVWLKSVAGIDNNYFRAESVEISGSTPSWYDAFVRNDRRNMRPENDYVPYGFVQINPTPNTDKIDTGIVDAFGDYGFTWTNNLCGNARTFWRSTTTNNHLVFYPGTNYTRGVDQLYVTATLYDAGETAVPELYLEDWGTNGVNWQVVSRAKIGSYLSGGVTFNKWAWYAEMRDFALATNGIFKVQLLNVYGTNDANQAKYGVERFCVYAPKQKNPVEAPRFHKRSLPPSDGLAGVWDVGDVVLNDFTVVSNVFGWHNKAYGQAGNWPAFGDVVGPTSRGQYEIPMFSGSTSNGISGAGIYGTGAGGKLGLGTADVSSAGRIRIADSTALPTILISNSRLGVNPFIQVSDGVDHAGSFGIDSTNNHTFIGESSTHLTLRGGNVGIGTASPTSKLHVAGNALVTGGTVSDTFEANTSITLGGVTRNSWPSDTDQLVKVSSGDTTAQYLEQKLVAGSNVTITKNNAGGVETLTISSATGEGGGSTNYNFQTPLQVQAGTNVSITANGIDNTLIRQSGARSVIGRAANSTGNVADISGGGANQILMDTGSALQFQALPNDISTQKVIVSSNATQIATRKEINFKGTNGVSVIVVDNAGSNRADVIVDAPGTNITTTAAGDLLEFESGGVSEYTLTDSYADIDFGGGAVMETTSLSAGTYIITAVVEFNQYREGGQQVFVRLFNEYSGFPVLGSEKLCGPQIISGQFLGDWVVTTQGKVVLPATGVIAVQARNSVSGDTDSTVKKDRSTLSWIKVQ